MNSASPWPAAQRPTAESVRRRRALVEAAAAGDLDTVIAHVDDVDDRIRSSALTALHRLGALSSERISVAVGDKSPRVRRAIAHVGAMDHSVPLDQLLGDTDAAVVEVACWAAGERADAGAPLLPLLCGLVSDHADALCRESAVAALGAIGDERALPTILTATTDRATVRRRAILALAPFDTPEVTAALERALDDRDWQVRQAAEDLS